MLTYWQDPSMLDAAPALFGHAMRSRVPAGFHRWLDGAPPPALQIKAVLLRGRLCRLARGEHETMRRDNRGWSLLAWQRIPPGLVLAPRWLAFPEAQPAPGLFCCVMYFDLQSELGDCAGFGRYCERWPFGEFEQRAAWPGEPPPDDPARWAPYAWRAADLLEIGDARLAASLNGS